MSEQKREIDLKLLKKIILHDYKERIKNNSPNEESILDAYVESINAKAKEHELEDHIFVKKLKGPISAKEINDILHYKYKITIFNLNIRCKDDVHDNITVDVFSGNKDGSASYKYSANPHTTGLFFEFKNNFFKLNSLQRRGYLKVTLGHCVNWFFVGNSFEGVNFAAQILAPAVARLDFKNNNFKNNEVNIDAIDEQPYETKCIITISNNEFNNLCIKGNGNFHFTGENTIRQLKIMSIDYYETSRLRPLPIVHWGAHQKLDEDGRYFFAHKKIFITLKQKATANGDTTQEMILQREIAKCDHAIVKSEKGWGTYQDKAIFGFSKWISNYGTSWIRPLLLLTVLNLVVACLVQLICSETKATFLVVFFELFNPTSYLPKLLGSEGAGVSGLISFLFISQKIVLAFTLYEMIKIFRRFGRR